jgi:hypothetical protein
MNFRSEKLAIETHPVNERLPIGRGTELVMMTLHARENR